MGKPKAYKPEFGYKYQILTRYGNQEYEHYDYAKDHHELRYLLKEYRLADSNERQFIIIPLPKKYYKKREE